jgi:hypothetical protein
MKWLIAGVQPGDSLFFHYRCEGLMHLCDASLLCWN